MLTEFEKYGILSAEKEKCYEEEFPFLFITESACLVEMRIEKNGLSPWSRFPEME